MSPFSLSLSLSFQGLNISLQNLFKVQSGLVSHTWSLLKISELSGFLTTSLSKKLKRRHYSDKKTWKQNLLINILRKSRNWQITCWLCDLFSKAVNIIHNARHWAVAVKKSYPRQMVPELCRSASAVSMLCLSVDFTLTAELAPAFAALLQTSNWSNYRENAFLIRHFLFCDTLVRMCESGKRSGVEEWIFPLILMSVI